MFSFALLFAGCEDFFTSTLKVDPPPHEDQLVLHSYISDSDSLVGLSLTKSFGLLDDVLDDDYVNDAVVELYKDGNLWKTLELLPSNFRPFNYGVELEGKVGNSNSEFEIKITHGTYPNIEARQQMPRKVLLKSAKFEENLGIDEYGEREDGVEIIFDDPPGEENFYEVALLQLDTSGGDVYISREYASVNDPTAFETFRGGSYLLDDKTFDGKTYELALLYCCITPNHYIEFRTLSKELYLYTKSLTQQYNAEDFGAFSEPVSINTNVENGLGIFGMRTQAYVHVER